MNKCIDNHYTNREYALEDALNRISKEYEDFQFKEIKTDNIQEIFHTQIFNIIHF